MAEYDLLEVVFAARGGEGPYSWSVTAPANGSVHVEGWSQCRYRCLQPGNNTLRVEDQQGHFATARITPLQDAMSVQPSSVTLNNTLDASFVVSGGSPPYVWTTANPALGAVSFNSATSYQASYRAVSGASGVNVVTVSDAEGRTATATVTQN
ncbi:MAG: hypothetical protein LC725_12930 [Lentisphaerae bacterium]|nr:hypothetical protein [Lentisphaerota bacterium]